MKRIFTTADFIVVSQLKDVLEMSGIPCELRNGTASVVPGVLPELWVLKDTDAEKSEQLIREWQRAEYSGQGVWICPECHEEIEGEFFSCWKCGCEKPK